MIANGNSITDWTYGEPISCRATGDLAASGIARLDAPLLSVYPKYSLYFKIVVVLTLDFYIHIHNYCIILIKNEF